MPELPKVPKLPPKTILIGLAAAAVFVFFAVDNGRLRSNLDSTTRITQNLREELDGLRRENQTFKDRENTGQTQLESLSAELSSLREDKSLFSTRQEELKKQVTEAEATLQTQNRRVRELEVKLKDAEEKMKRQKRTSSNLEEQTRSAKANPGMTREYVKIVESEWFAAVSKTEELRKDLDRTLAELSGQNQERSRLRNDTATMHYNLAVILSEQQNYPAAILEYQKVLEIRPTDAEAHYNLGVIYDEYLRNTEKAVEHYRQFVKTAPESPEAPKVREWIKQKEFDNTFKFKL